MRLAPRWLLAFCAVSTTSISRSWAERPPNGDASAEPSPSPSSPRSEELLPITAPRALDAAVDYPPGAEGDHEVVLELTIDEQGRVKRAKAIVGKPPFSAQAERAALGWHFEPARRGSTPVASKVHFQVRFEQPEESLAEQEEAEAAVAEAPPEQAPIEVQVAGERPGLRRRLGQVEIRQLPGAFGDPFRAVEALPGVVPVVSGLPYFFVRGAPPGNVGYFFDGIPVPYLFHFALGPGVLHPAFVESVDLYSGAYPAHLGRFAGAIVAGEIAPPQHRWRGQGNLRLLDSGGVLEAPFAGGRGSVMLGGRYSYTAAVLSLLDPQTTADYWDYQSRVSYQLDEDDRLELFSFGAADFLQERPDPERDETETPLDIYFHRLDLRWERSLPRGRFRQALMLGVDNSAIDNGKLEFRTHMLGLRSDLTHTLSSQVGLKAGIDLLYEHARQSLEKPLTDLGEENVTVVVDENGNETELPQEYEGSNGGLGFDRSRNDFTLGGHAAVVIDAAPGVELIPGLRSDVYVSGDQVAVGIDPRITARFSLTPRVALTHGLGLVHQAPSFIVPLPGIKSSLKGGLQRAAQHTAGVEVQLPFGIASSASVFQNLFFNMTDLLGTGQLGGDGEERAMGHGYGAEFELRRGPEHDLSGFLSYTLSRSQRSFGRFQGPAASDRTHVLNAALGYNLGRNWHFGSRFVFYSGKPATVDGLPLVKDPPRTPPYWRIDWRLEKRWPYADQSGHWALTFEVLNTTLNKEVVNRECMQGRCSDEKVGPIILPIVGLEAVY